ncbi:MAG: FHA domain-containing protein [Anaerolineae bacterium]|nr:FHA domain-containing protein [Anaerolineae bacterium]MCO5205580.1 FHA domain-containing protein [Anaerolineae bacterium]
MSSNILGKLLSGPAAAVLLLCFFLPWIAVSCEGLSVAEFSGYDLASGAGDLLNSPEVTDLGLEVQSNLSLVLYAIPVIAVIIVIVVILAFSTIDESRAGLITIILGVLGLLVMAGFFLWWQNTRGQLQLDELGYLVDLDGRIGFWGSLAGLIVTVIGGAIMYSQGRQPEQIFSPLPQTMPPTGGMPPPPPIAPDPLPADLAPGPTVGMGAFPSSEPDEMYSRPSPKTEVIHQEPQALAWLVIGEGPRVGHQFRLLENNGIGRNADNEIVIDDSSMSGQHARVRLEDDTFFVYDLASTNGTFRFDKEQGEWVQIYREPLADGDRIKFGRTVLHFMELDTSKPDDNQA